MSQVSLYMLALMPPQPLAGEIAQKREEFARLYNCSAALKPPVHITLIPPYKTTATTEQFLIEDLSTWAALQIPFPVTLQHYNSFRNNRVIFMNVLQNDLLCQFQNGLERKFVMGDGYPIIKTYSSYHPHITIGYRDIPGGLYAEAEREWLQKEFFATFVADKFYLWKHNTKYWQVLEEFTIGSKNF